MHQSRHLLTQAPLSYRWTIPYFIIAEDRLVGSIGGKGLLDEEDTVEIGYNVAPKYRRRGIATAAIREMLRYAAKDGLIVIAHVEPDNLASQRALTAAGMFLETVVRLPDKVVLQRWTSSPDQDAASFE